MSSIKEAPIAAGTYYIGDPSYVLPSKLVDELNDLIWFGTEGKPVGTYTLSNGIMVTALLVPMNGELDTNIGTKISVDSLMVAAVPFDACTEDDPVEAGIVTKFRSDTTAVAFDNGDCAFGGIVVFAKCQDTCPDCFGGMSRDLFGA
jgi:hypothetical protein